MGKAGHNNGAITATQHAKVHWADAIFGTIIRKIFGHILSANRFGAAVRGRRGPAKIILHNSIIYLSGEEAARFEQHR